MGRTRKSNREPAHPKPVEKVELSEKHVKLRFVLVILLALIGATGIGFGVSSLFGTDSGWQEIEAKSQELNCSDDFIFLYYLGDSGTSASAENRALTLAYSEAVGEAYRLFTNDVDFDGVYNVRYINQHPNQEIQVEEALYQAFSKLEKYGDRHLYLAPVYMQYDDIFSSNDDTEAMYYDPYRNGEVAAEYADIAAYARDSASVNLDLLGDNKVRLTVSAEYLSYAEENAITSFIDFFWMKNAFIADYLAEAMIAEGYTHGCLSSYDGFIRNLDDSSFKYSVNLYDRQDGTVYPAALLNYAGPMSMVYLRNYGINSRDKENYYELQDGSIRTPYLDMNDGLCKSSRSDLLCYGEQVDCADVLLQMAPIYIADSFQAEQVALLKNVGIFTVYCDNGMILYNDPSAAFSNLYQDELISYQLKLVE